MNEVLLLCFCGAIYEAAISLRKTQQFVHQKSELLGGEGRPTPELLGKPAPVQGKSAKREAFTGRCCGPGLLSFFLVFVGRDEPERMQFYRFLHLFSLISPRGCLDMENLSSFVSFT